MKRNAKQDIEEIRAALNAAFRCVRRDECGDWHVRGSRGHIYADGEGWLIVLGCRSALAWTWAKKRLAFCRVTQDGNDEGCLHLGRLPDQREAIEIRDLLGIRQTVIVSPDRAASLVKSIAH